MKESVIELQANASLPFFVGAIVILLIGCVVWVTISYKKCPPGKVMVIYGYLGTDADGNPITFKCINGGATVVIPILQSYAYLDLEPVSIQVEVEEAGLKVEVTAGISTEPDLLNQAAQHLIGIKQSVVESLVKDITRGQLQQMIADAEEMPADKYQFLEMAVPNVEDGLKPIGMRVIRMEIVRMKEIDKI